MNATTGVGAAMAASTNDKTRPQKGGYPKGAITPAMRLRMDTLADVVAEGANTVADAAFALGWPQSTGDRVWQTIRRELGPQAS